MQNLIGDDVNNLSEFTANERAKIHLYAKDEVKIGRKMGHVNILTKNDQCLKYLILHMN